MSCNIRRERICMIFPLRFCIEKGWQDIISHTSKFKATLLWQPQRAYSGTVTHNVFNVVFHIHKTYLGKEIKGVETCGVLSAFVYKGRAGINLARMQTCPSVCEVDSKWCLADPPQGSFFASWMTEKFRKGFEKGYWEWRDVFSLTSP